MKDISPLPHDQTKILASFEEAVRQEELKTHPPVTVAEAPPARDNPPPSPAATPATNEADNSNDDNSKPTPLADPTLSSVTFKSSPEVIGEAPQITSKAQVSVLGPTVAPSLINRAKERLQEPVIKIAVIIAVALVLFVAIYANFLA